MKIKRIENLYQITFLPAVFPVNCFVIEREKDLIVIDMGIKGFVNEIKKISNQTHKMVHKLLLTHMHGDHVNGVNFFHEAFPEVSIGISKRDFKILKGDLALEVGEPQTKIKGSHPKEPVHIDFTFEEGELIDSLLVVASPGHTPGSVSFFEPEKGWLIVGDAYQIKGGVAVSGTRKWRFPFPAMATWNPGVALESGKKLLALEPSILAVGHGSFIEQPQKIMEAAILEAEELIKQ